MNKKTSDTNATSTAMLNKLRAAVLGANDGIVSTSSVVMGVAGATDNINVIFTAGLAALVAGAMSMAVGEYVSVSSALDTQKADMKRTKVDHSELIEDDFNSPTQAAVASLLSFTVGGVIPFVAVIATPQQLRIQATFIAVVAALILTGYLSAKVGRANITRAVIRVVIGGVLAMAITYLIGSLFGAQIA